MSRVEQTIRREDGSEVKIMAQSAYGLGLTRSVGVHLLHRENENEPWELASDQPHTDWKTMSVEDYIKHGRSPMLQLVSHAEILKVLALLTEADQQEVDCVAPQSAARARMRQN